MNLSRRKFLESSALTGLVAQYAVAAKTDKATGMPMRKLGRTGAWVSVLGFGGGSRFLMFKDEDKALEALNRALDLGIRYVDTASSYGNGVSEQRIGKVLKTRKETNIWLTTKISPRKADDAMRMIERSLKNLQRDHVDLLHMHSLADEKDLAAIEAPDGVLKLYYKLRDQKVARHIGVTCHGDPFVLKTMLERHDLDCTQMALNAGRMGMSASGKPKDGEAPSQVSFETVALPVALRKKMGVTAMKIFAQDKLLGKATPEKLIRYALSLPVASAMAGMPTMQMLEQDIAAAKAFKPLPKSEMKVLAQELSREYKVAMDTYFRDHVDA